MLLGVLEKLPCLSVLEKDDVKRLGLHLYAVCFSIRAAHWVKQLPLGLSGAQELAAALSRPEFPMARVNLIFIFEPLSGRVLAVNKHLTQSRLIAQLDEGFDSPDQWFIKFDRAGNGSFVDHEEVPFFSKALKALVKKMEAVTEEDGVVSVLEMDPDWISEIGCEKQALLRLVTIQHFLLGYPAIYVVDEAADSVTESCALLAQRRAWIGNVLLEGERQEDDHLLIKCTFPEGLFSPDSMDMSDKTAQLSLAEVSDRMQTRLLEQLDVGDLRKVWRDVTVNIEGPFPHQQAWQACGLRHYAFTESKWTSSSRSSNSENSSPATTPSEE